MSQKDAEQAQTTPQLETVEHVSAAVKGQKKLLLGLMARSAISMLSAAFAILITMGNGAPEEAEIATLPQDTIVRQLDGRVNGLSERIDEVLALTQQTQDDLAQLSKQLAAIDVNDERNVITCMQRLLIKQEQDFQAFVDSLEDGMYNFHMMIPHSGGWWAEYKTELDAMNEMSVARENYASTLRDN